jgi:hypothetical protein
MMDEILFPTFFLCVINNQRLFIAEDRKDNRENFMNELRAAGRKRKPRTTHILCRLIDVKCSVYLCEKKDLQVVDDVAKAPM